MSASARALALVASTSATASSRAREHSCRRDERRFVDPAVEARRTLVGARELVGGHGVRAHGEARTGVKGARPIGRPAHAIAGERRRDHVAVARAGRGAAGHTRGAIAPAGAYLEEAAREVVGDE